MGLWDGGGVWICLTNNTQHPWVVLCFPMQGGGWLLESCKSSTSFSGIGGLTRLLASTDPIAPATAHSTDHRSIPFSRERKEEINTAATAVAAASCRHQQGRAQQREEEKRSQKKSTAKHKDHVSRLLIQFSEGLVGSEGLTGQFFGN